MSESREFDLGSAAWAIEGRLVAYEKPHQICAPDRKEITVIEKSAYDKAIEALREANEFLELFNAGSKRMSHDLNYQDTLDATSLYHKIKKILGEV